MGDLVPRPNADNCFWMRNADEVFTVYLTPVAAAAALLPSEFSLPKFPARGELTPVSLLFAKYGEGGTTAPYNEVAVTIPCLYNGQPYSYCPYICVDNDAALVYGREFLGFPKKLATFDLNCSSAQFIGVMERHGVRVVSFSFDQEEKLFSVPLPANEKMVLRAPFDHLFALPEPTGTPQGFPIAVVNTRFIADTIAPQHIVSVWRWEKGTVWTGKGRVEYAPSDTNPLAKLPVAQIIASVRFKGDMACHGEEVRLLAEMA
jgi:acetoacetate decarboxylase